jgi:hypothetical protein
MNVGHLTRLAGHIVAPLGVEVRYEWDGRVFKWNFYQSGNKCIKSIKKPSAVIAAAEKLTLT